MQRARRHRLFTGLTRLPELLGVPMGFWMIAVLPPLFFFMLTQQVGISALFLGLCYAIAHWLARRDAFLLHLIALRLSRTPETSGRGFWGGNSYGG